MSFGQEALGRLNPLAADLLDRMKGDLLLILVHRAGGRVVIPVAEVDDLPRGKLLKMETVENSETRSWDFVFTVEDKARPPATEHSAPGDLESYQKLYMANMRTTGQGLAVRQHIPCPFCCCPDQMIVPLADSRAHMERGATCAHCGRGWRVIFKEVSGAGVPAGLTFEMVQTSGPEQPAWFMPKMRRVPWTEAEMRARPGKPN